MPQHAGNEFFARCASGFEGTLAQELKGLGTQRVRPLKGGASFVGSLRDAYRACLWSRVTTRVQLVLARVDAHDADALYQGVYAFPWEDHVHAGATVAVQAHGQNANLRNTQFTALKVKDALCDRLREVRGSRPDVDAKDPDFSLDVSLHERRATLYLNLSGASLHRRGYREAGVQTEAPLKETLAAGILLAAGWEELARAGATFADPMCGSGTLAIEAALIAAGIAPGALRTRWGFQGWLGHDEELWQGVRREAELPKSALASSRLRILAGDIDPHAIGIARANARRAGVDGLIRFEVADAATLGERLKRLGKGTVPELGLVATNPPYGYRLQSAEQLPQTYAALGKAVAALPEGWQMAAITPDPGLDTALGQTASTVIPCYNGPLKATMRLYRIEPAQRNELQVTSLAGVARTVLVAERNSEQFAARLRKVARERAKWARRAGISCYRIYDADLPDYALSVDLYEGAGTDAGTRFARVEERPAPSSVDADRAARRLADALAIVPAVLDFDRTHVLVPAAQQGGVAKTDAAAPLCVEEASHRFVVDLTARQDTGLPLHQRDMRRLLATMADGTRFLCLNAYAGVPATYAAEGGAKGTTTVDPQKAFLDDARRTMQENGFTNNRHRFELAEVRAWLRQAAAAHRSYDLVYLDLVAFSGTEGGSAFDPQRDHVPCLALVGDVLAPGGSIVLTTSLRSFKLDRSALERRGFHVQDLSAETLPHDFARNPKLHRCWKLTKA